MLTRVPWPSPNYSSRGGSWVRLVVVHASEGATTYQALGKPEQARKHMAKTMTMYRDMGMSNWLVQAEAEMRQLQ